MLGNPRFVQLARFGIPVLLVIWILGYLTSSKESYNTIIKTHFKSEKDKFIAEFLDNDVGGDFDGSGIAKVCAEKKWTPGLILSCVPVDGGFAQVKNAHLNCIRFAIEMGAELVLPRIIKRDPRDIAITRPKNGKGPYVGELLDYLFDFDHLNQTLHQSCPQMKLYRSMNDLWDVPQVSPPRKISLASVEVALTNGSIINDMSKLNDQIQAYIERTAPAETRPHPIRFEVDAMNWVFPTGYDGHLFANNFGRILRPRKDARLLAAVALYNLQKRFGVLSSPSHNIQHNRFTGVHLRTEPDAVKTFPNFDTQSASLLGFIRDIHSRLVFVATGSTDEKQRKTFVDKAQELNATVVFKKDLLEDEGLLLLQEMSWDQRALVDYEIMLRSGKLAGPVESSFTWNLALMRSLIPGASEKPVLMSGEVPGAVQYRDKYSTILGQSPKGLVMQATVWP